MTYSPSSELYSQLARLLVDRLDLSGYFSGSVSLEFDDVDCRLTGSFIVYRQPCDLPEGIYRPIADVVPVWWEFHTRTEEGEVDNDFSFSELKPFLIA
ncbi:MAG: hypothetical protein RR330_04590 [Alistipes sp.]